MTKTKNVYLLRKLDSYSDSPHPGDKVFILKEGTNSGSSQTLSLDGILKDGAAIYHFQFKPLTVASGVVTAAAAVAGATDTVMNVVIANAEDFEMDGGE